MMIREHRYKGEQLILHWKETPVPLIDIIDWHIQIMKTVPSFKAKKDLDMFYCVDLCPCLFQELDIFRIPHNMGTFYWRDVRVMPALFSETSRMMHPNISFLMYADCLGVTYGC